MKYFALAALFSWIGMAQANVEEYVFANVTRRTGGQEINQPLNIKPQMTMTLFAQKYALLIRDITVYTVSSETVNFADLKHQMTNQLDAEGRLLLRPNQSVMFSVQTRDAINGVSIIAESMGGFSTLILKVEERMGGESPIVPAPPEEDPQELCRSQVYDLTGRLAVCSQDTTRTNSEIMREQRRISELQEALARVNEPLLRCQENKSKMESQLNQMRAQVLQNRDHARAIRQNIGVIRMAWKEMQDRHGKTIHCVVVGRHARFEGSGPTLGTALAKAMEQCGVNNCGKNDWDKQYRCDYRK